MLLALDATPVLAANAPGPAQSAVNAAGFAPAEEQRLHALLDQSTGSYLRVVQACRAGPTPPVAPPAPQAVHSSAVPAPDLRVVTPEARSNHGRSSPLRCRRSSHWRMSITPVHGSGSTSAAGSCAVVRASGSPCSSSTTPSARHPLRIRRLRANERPCASHSTKAPSQDRGSG